MSNMYEDLAPLWNSLSEDIFQTSKDHGFHGTSELDNVPTKLMLIVSELAEAMEAHRKNLTSDHLPSFSGMEEELADAVIRIMDLCWLLELDLPRAILAKHHYNTTRPYMHGNKAY